MQKRARWLEITIVPFAATVGWFGCGGAAPNEDLGTASEALIGDSLPGLNNTERANFADGKAAFKNVETAADGLGPGFNDAACGNCHKAGAVGGGAAIFEVRVGKLVNGVFNPLASEGGELLQLHGIGNAVPGCNFTGEVPPADATIVAKRRTTPLFGLGFVDDTPDSTFTSLAASQPTAIRGRVNMVRNISKGANTVGKFGWKAQVPTLFQFSGDAYLNEMGITNPQFPNENLPNGSAALLAACDKVPELEDDGSDVTNFNNFMRLLAAPEPLAGTNASRAGDQTFTTIGCDGCHVRTITSGNSVNSGLAFKDYHPFSDFLLHDMGSLGDGIADNGIATGREIRTTPLWGIRFLDPTKLLHDGRATSIQDAILKHDGQGKASRDKFNALSSTDKSNVVEFLKHL
jgi:CxxC motif-containing protein (DUF1111 family)